MYVAVKGGERAIENAHRLLAHERRGDRGVPEVTLPQITEQLGLAVDRVMSEGSLYDRELAGVVSRDAARHRHFGPRRADRAVTAGRSRCAGWRSHPRAPGLSCRPRSAAAKSRPRR